MKYLLILSLLVLLPSLSTAETVYVTDMLKLSVHEKPQSKGNKITTLSSGDPITVLETVPGYSKIRTQGNEIGWTKSAYLVKDKPPRLIVDQLTQQLQSLQQRSASALEEVNKARGSATEYQELLQANQQSLEQTQQQLETAVNKNNDYESSMEQYQSSIPLKLFLIACVVLFIIGVALGWFILDYRQRMRHGGYRL